MMQLSVIILFLILSGSFAKDLYVSPRGSDSNPGTYTAPYKEITQALRQAAFSGDTIFLFPGVYPSQFSSYIVLKQTTIKSLDGPSNTTVLCTGRNGGFTVTTRNFAIEGVSIQNCNEGIKLALGKVIVSNCVFNTTQNAITIPLDAKDVGISVQDSIFYNYDYGIKSSAKYYVSFSIVVNNCSFYRGNTFAVTTNTIDSIQSIYITNSTFVDNNGVLSSSANETVITSCTFRNGRRFNAVLSIYKSVLSLSDSLFLNNSGPCVSVLTNSSILIDKVYFEGNDGYFGVAGIDCSIGSGKVTNSQFISNLGKRASAFFCRSDCNLDFYGCYFYNNQPEYQSDDHCHVVQGQ